MIEPIYISRPVLQMSALGLYEFATAIQLDPETFVPDLHVTLAYSTDPVNWDDPAFQMDPTQLTIEGAEDRAVEMLDGGAVVLRISSRALSQRWSQFIMAGASWDHDDFKPHITLAYDEGYDMDNVGRSMYGPGIVFGAEQREWLNTEF